MTVVAVLWPKAALYKGKEAARPHRFWCITWRGPCGAFSSGQPYRSQDAAEQMARDCGAKEIQQAEEERP